LNTATLAFRNLRRGGGLSATIVLILAVAIGGVTAIFSIANAVLMRPLPVADPDRVMLLWGQDAARSQQVVEVSLQDQRAWLAAQKSFTAIELFGSVNWGELQIAGPGPPFHATENMVSSGFFDVLGARPILGRTFRPADERRGARPTVVLSAGIWRQQFSSDPSVIGRLLITGTGTRAAAVEVIGVMPPDFRIPAGAQVWMPLGLALAPPAGAEGFPTDAVRAMYAIGRLAPGATVASAAAELSIIARNEELKHGMTTASMAVVATPLSKYLLGSARPALLAIAGASCALLLIACANAAALLLVQGARRRREVAVRLALGARRLQIVRLLVCESIVLCLIAGVLGVAVAYSSFNAIVSLAPIEVPRLDEAAIDLSALLFALVLCLGTAIAVGLFPAWRYSGASSLVGVHERSRSATVSSSSTRMRKLLVAAQLTVVVVLLTGAGLFIRSFTALLRLDLGFEPRGVVTFNLDVSEDKYDTNERRWALVDAVLDGARRLPGVVAAGAVYQRPFANGAIGMDVGIVLDGQRVGAANGNPIVNWEEATPDYFRAMDIRLLHGRLFDDRDTAKSPPVVIIGQALAARLWPGQSAIGKRLITYGAPGEAQHPAWQTVIGVVEDARYREVEVPRFDLYLPYRQAPNQVQDFVVRFSGDPRQAISMVRSTIASIDPDVRIAGISTMDDVVGRAFAPWRFSSVVVTVFAVVGLMFAAVGIGALVAFAVTQRTREIGVRVALGAQTRDVVVLVALEGAWMALAGLVGGLVVAWMVRRSVESMLFGVKPNDALTFGGVALLLGVVSLLAAYLPARRAARIDPASALRAE
jgi:predicted permease